MSAGPIRTCAGCRARRPQGELIRVVRTARGLEVEPVRPSGRGAYVCVDHACVDRALRSGSLRRRLRFDGALPADLGARLSEAIERRREAGPPPPRPAPGRDE